MLETTLDSVIRASYMKFGMPADQIVTEPGMIERFADEVNGRLPQKSRYGIGDIARRLLTLRKRGEDRGGLPRLERAYYGRG